MPNLITLKLNLYFISNYDEETPNYFWYPLTQFQHLTLQHLTLIIENNLSKKPLNVLEQYSIPPLPILQQLTTFNFFNQENKLLEINSHICQLILNSPYGTHLKPGVGARFGLRVTQNNLKKVELEKELLLYFTYFDAHIDWERKNSSQFAKTNFFRALTHMRHLQKVELEIFSSEKTTDYPSILTTLSLLAHLRELTIACNNYKEIGDGTLVWPGSSMPVLPLVRVFSLCFNTPNHTDVVEQFNLTHCFPGLKILRCHFGQTICNHCDYKTLNYCSKALFEKCGRKLSCGLEELKIPGTVLKKEIKFSVWDNENDPLINFFPFLNHNCSYIETFLDNKRVNTSKTPCVHKPPVFAS